MLNAHRVQIIHNANTYVTLEYGGQILFVVFEVIAQPLQGKIRIGEMLVHVFLNHGDQVGTSLVVFGEI